ncbi:MAG: hypothetical protein ACXADY_26680 [Candidatus Hodarchaeales archaeon]|jgi:hypothetical protein
MNTKTYIKHFKTENQALNSMKLYNKNLISKSIKDMRVVVEGPNDNYSVVNFETAQDLQCGYKWEV